jgi:hypothetical protein
MRHSNGSIVEITSNVAHALTPVALVRLVFNIAQSTLYVLTFSLILFIMLRNISGDIAAENNRPRTRQEASNRTRR